MKVISNRAILKIYKDRNWLIFEPDLHRANAIAKAQFEQDMSDIKALQESVKMNKYDERDWLLTVEEKAQIDGVIDLHEAQERKKQAYREAGGLILNPDA